MQATAAPDGNPRFPFTPATLFDPPEEFGHLRAARPVARVSLPTGDEAWLVTRYEDVRLILADPRFSRAAAVAPGAPRLRPVPPDTESIMSMDPPAHHRLRRLVAGAFSRGTVEALRPGVHRIVDGLLDRIGHTGPPADLVDGLGGPLAITVICELLGVPAGERPTFRGWTDTVLSLDPGSREEIMTARRSLNGYLAGLVAVKRRDPGDDVMSLLIAARDDGDRLSEAELLAFSSTLLIAGYHTVTTAVANGVLTLLRQPTGLKPLQHPQTLTAAIEELLRHTPGAASGGTIRVALEDVELGGVTVRAGEAVIPAISSANRDERAFADPDEFRTDRPANNHLAFGHGIHHCLGAPLARLELSVALGSLARRFPDMRVAVADDQLDWGGSSMIRALRSLPVTW